MKILKIIGGYILVVLVLIVVILCMLFLFIIVLLLSLSRILLTTAEIMGVISIAKTLLAALRAAGAKEDSDAMQILRAAVAKEEPDNE